MYTHILVPLDGSKLAEQVIPHAKMLASLEPGAIVTLLRAVPPVATVATTEYGIVLPTPIEEAGTTQEEAQHYLDTIASELTEQGCTVQVHVSSLPAAEAIVEFAEVNGVDLIAIATHGRSGIGRWVFGSVTQKVLHGTHTPMLVIRPTES